MQSKARETFSAQVPRQERRNKSSHFWAQLLYCFQGSLGAAAIMFTSKDLFCSRVRNLLTTIIRHLTSLNTSFFSVLSRSAAVVWFPKTCLFPSIQFTHQFPRVPFPPLFLPCSFLFLLVSSHNVAYRKTFLFHYFSYHFPFSSLCPCLCIFCHASFC